MYVPQPSTTGYLSAYDRVEKLGKDDEKSVDEAVNPTPAGYNTTPLSASTGYLNLDKGKAVDSNGVGYNIMPLSASTGYLNLDMGEAVDPNALGYNTMPISKSADYLNLDKVVTLENCRTLPARRDYQQLSENPSSIDKHDYEDLMQTRF